MNEIKCVIVELEPYKIGNLFETHNHMIRVCEIEGSIYL